jgi:GWxTD domain-containing protein
LGITFTHMLLFKRKLTLLVCLLGVSIQLLALRVTFDYRVFYAPGVGPYAEFVTSFDASTFQHQVLDSGYVQAHAELTLVLTRAGSIVDARKVKVDGPVVKGNEMSDFLSIERFAIPAGNYDLEIEIRDTNAPEKSAESLTQKIEIVMPAKGVFISDVEWVSAYRQSSDDNAFSKSGYDMIPFVSSYFGTSLNSLIYYAEIYRTDSVWGVGSPFVTTICIVNMKDNSVEFCKRVKKEKAASVVPMLQTMDISDVPAGQYKLRIEARDRENNLVAMREREFSRNKIAELPDAPPTAEVTAAQVSLSFASRFTDADSLRQILFYHIPIAKDVDRDAIDRQIPKADLSTMQSFLYSFWWKRNPENPEAAWLEYAKSIQVVRDNFETRIKKGWQTDRGRVYLQYGPPNTRIVRNNEVDYWPFEIWHYYSTDNNLHNRRFLFYDTTLMGDMDLLHSDVPEETKNFNWKEMVRSRPTALNMGDSSVRNANNRTDTNSRDEIENLWYSPH